MQPEPSIYGMELEKNYFACDPVVQNIFSACGR